MRARDPMFHEHYELDRAGGAWLLTTWPDVKPDITLRLRIPDYDTL
jgi:hypothetical protein